MRHTREPVRKPDITDSVYKVPFFFGWIRLVVFRALTSKRIMDIYYKPSVHGKRLRSLVEVQKYLIENDINYLSPIHFSFSPDMTGMNKKKEIIYDKHNVLDTIIKKRREAYESKPAKLVAAQRKKKSPTAVIPPSKRKMKYDKPSTSRCNQ